MTLHRSHFILIASLGLCILLAACQSPDPTDPAPADDSAQETGPEQSGDDQPDQDGGAPPAPDSAPRFGDLTPVELGEPGVAPDDVLQELSFFTGGGGFDGVCSFNVIADRQEGIHWHNAFYGAPVSIIDGVVGFSADGFDDESAITWTLTGPDGIQITEETTPFIGEAHGSTFDCNARWSAPVGADFSTGSYQVTMQQGDTTLTDSFELVYPDWPGIRRMPQEGTPLGGPILLHGFAPGEAVTLILYSDPSLLQSTVSTEGVAVFAGEHTVTVNSQGMALVNVPIETTAAIAQGEQTPQVMYSDIPYNVASAGLIDRFLLQEARPSDAIPVRASALSNDGAFAAQSDRSSGSEGTSDGYSIIALASQKTGQVLRYGTPGYEGFAAFSPDDSLLAGLATPACDIVDCNTRLNIWDTATGDLLSETIRVMNVPFVWATEGESIFYLTDKGELFRYSVTSNSVEWVVEGPVAPFSALAISADGSLLATGSLDHSVQVWDAETGDLISHLPQIRVGTIRSVGFSPDGTMLAWNYDTNLGYFDGEGFAAVWDLDAGALAYTLPQTGEWDAVTWSPDGSILAVGSTFWAAASGEHLGSLGTSDGIGSIIGPLHWSPDGHSIYVTSGDTLVYSTDFDFGAAPVVSEVVCPGSLPSRLSVGAGARVTIGNGLKLRVRDKPTTQGSSILIQLEEGTEFTITGGPECANNWTWWEIEDGDGNTGWVSEGDVDDGYFVEPYP